MFGIVLIFIVLLATLAQSRFLPDTDARLKRQSADVRMAEYAALQGLLAHLSRECVEIACGLVDVVASGKKKRDVPFGSENMAALQRYTLLKALLQRSEEDKS